MTAAGRVTAASPRAAPGRGPDKSHPPSKPHPSKPHPNRSHPSRSHANESRPSRSSDRSSARERILRATLELIAAKGVAAVTNRRVASAARVSLGSLTYHFASQTELLREALLVYVQEETDRRELVARELEQEHPGIERVAAVVERLAGLPSELPSQIAELELHLHAARDPELREASSRCFAAHERVAAAALTALEVPDGERHAGTVVALLSGLAIRRLAAGGTDASGTADALVALVRGLDPGRER